MPYFVSAWFHKIASSLRSSQWHVVGLFTISSIFGLFFLKALLYHPPRKEKVFVGIIRAQVSKPNHFVNTKINLWKLSFSLSTRVKWCQFIRMELYWFASEMLDSKVRIEKQDNKEGRLYRHPSGFLKDGWTDPPQISKGYPIDWRFLLKRDNGISYPLYVTPLLRRCFLKTSPHNQQKPLQNERSSILENMAIGLIRRRKGGLGNLSVSPRPKRKIGGMVISDHQRSEHQIPPFPMNHPAASSGVSSSLPYRHSVLDTESSWFFWIPAFAGMTTSRQAAGNITRRDSMLHLQVFERDKWNVLLKKIIPS